MNTGCNYLKLFALSHRLISGIRSLNTFSFDRTVRTRSYRTQLWISLFSCTNFRTAVSILSHVSCVILWSIVKCVRLGGCSGDFVQDVRFIGYVDSAAKNVCNKLCGVLQSIWPYYVFNYIWLDLPNWFIWGL